MQERESKGSRKRNLTLIPILWIGMGLLLGLLVLLSRPRNRPESETANHFPTNRQIGDLASTAGEAHLPMARAATRPEAPPVSAAEIVSRKLIQFGESRRGIIHAISRKTGKPAPAKIEEFFDAVGAGKWEEIDRQFGVMAKGSGQDEGSSHRPELDAFWPAVLETYGVAEQAHLWPPQKLLDYGEAILGALKPGMVYVGGTDPGRFIPALLNETGEGEAHIILTQNALADGRYREYVQFLYGDRFNVYDAGESDAAFSHYTTDVQKRLEHDERFPNEPKRMKPGEKVEMVDGKVQVSGQAGVMDINERLLQMILQKNPGALFAVEESYPMRHTYAGAVPLGPIMEIRAQDAKEPIDDAHAGQALQYWRETKDQLVADPEAQNSRDATLLTYAKMAAAQGNLLAYGNRGADAEQAYRLGLEIHSGSPEAVYGLANLLGNSGRGDEAKQIIANAQRANPDFQKHADSAPFWMISHSKP